MRVLLDNVVIAAGGHESPSGFSLVETRAVQAVDYVRGTFGAQFARRAYRHEIGFQIWRLHSDLRAALLFVVDHPQAVPASGVLSLLYDDRGASSGGRWINGAVTTRVECLRMVGMSTLWSYGFVGGAILRTHPRYAAAT